MFYKSMHSHQDYAVKDNNRCYILKSFHCTNNIHCTNNKKTFSLFFSTMQGSEASQWLIMQLESDYLINI